MSLASLILIPLCSLTVPQEPLRLPPLPPQQGQPEQPGQQLSDKEKFQRLLVDLESSGGNADAVLQRFGTEIRDLPDHLLVAVRKGTPRLLERLAPVITRFGDRKVAEEIHYQLQVRSLGRATRPLVQAMVKLQQGDAVDRLFDLVRAREAHVRREAVAALSARIRPEHIQEVETLSHDRDRSLQLAGIELLGALHHGDARARLVELLTERATVAAAAVSALLQHGQDAVGPLQKVLEGPAMDRSYGYAAFALAQLEEQSGRELIPTEAARTLLLELDNPDTLQRILVAFALERLAFRSADADPSVWRDNDIVGALLEVAAPLEPISNLSLLGPPAERALARFTGQQTLTGVIPWREWHAQRDARYLGLRRNVEVDAETARSALLSLQRGNRTIRLVGEGLPAVVGRTTSTDVMLAAEELHQLVGDLERMGFGQPRPVDNDALLAARAGVATQTLALERAGVRTARTAPMDDRAFARFAQRVELAFRAERWQLYGDPSGELDPVEFWHRERRWLAEHPDPSERNRRMVQLIVAAIERMPGAGKSPTFEEARAVQHLLEIDSVTDLLTEDQALRLVQTVRQRGLVVAGEPDPVRLGLLEVAMSNPGDAPWKAVMDEVAEVTSDASMTVEARTQLLSNLFRVMGPERLIEALSDPRQEVRLTAAQQAAEAGDRDAVPPLLSMLDDDSLAVRRAAVYALGRLRTASARKILAERLQQPDADPGFRRDALVALGRIGGPGVADFLGNAFALAGDTDRRAILAGLGAMRESHAANLLAELFVAHHDNPLGDIAEAQLERQGPLLAGPALRERLGTQNLGTRRRLARVLGRFQDPAALPDLIDMLEGESNQLETVLLIEGITGVDLARRNRRVDFMRQWFTVQRSRSQAEWYLTALADAGITHELTPGQLVMGAGMAGVPELARLLTDADAPRIRVLTSKMLRDVTGVDYGVVGPGTPPERLLSIADRYRSLAGTDTQAADTRAAGGRR